MDSSLHVIGIGCLAGALFACFAVVISYLNLRSEYYRAVKAGEITPDTGGRYAPPLAFLVRANALPGAEASRRRMIRNTTIFICFCVAATTVVAIDCAQPATSMSEPWFWLLSLAVVAILVSGRGDEIVLPVRRQFGYVVIAAGAAMAVAHLRLYSAYTSALPRIPQPATGNLVPLNDHGLLVFINPWQSTRLIWLQFGAIVFALCGAIIVRYAAERETRRK